MGDSQAMMQEFAARKAQVLNLEMRQFVLVMAIELVFIFAFVYFIERTWLSKAFSIGSASVYFALFFELVAINGKMGLVSVYLKQLEGFMASQGQVGAVWESKALSAIVFPIGNSFTLPAAIAISVLLGQAIFVSYCQIRHFTDTPAVQIAVTMVFAGVLIAVLLKTLTVDFQAKVPNVF